MGAAVRRRRRTLELTLSAVAERSGLSVPFLSQVENERARPSRRSLEKVADALGTTAVELLAAADPAHTVDLVRADDTSVEDTAAAENAETAETAEGADFVVRSLVRGHHQMNAQEFVGDHDPRREFQLRNDVLMHVTEGAVEVEAEGRVYRLVRGDTLYLTGGVRHRWRAAGADTRVLVVAVAEHIDAVDEPGRK